MKSIIVAYDKNFGIGAANDLLWARDLPADLAHFKQITMGSTIIMGYNTYLSIGRPLPGRQNIVINWEYEDIQGFDVVTSLDEAYSISKNEQVFVIGGGSIYKLAIDTVDKLYATEVQATFEKADVFFPEVNKDTWREVSREKYSADEKNKYDYDFVVYERV